MKIRPVGYVYVLTNPSMPHLVKVGMTDRHNTQQRITELSTHTGVPEEFELAYRAQVYDAYQVEQRAHALLAEMCQKKKEFFQCDVIVAIDAVFAAAGDDLIAEESHIGLSDVGSDATRLAKGRIRLAILQARGKSLTGVTRLPFDKQPKGIKEKIAWSLHSPTYGYLFYGHNISTAEQLLIEARRTFSEVNDFCNPILVETDAGNRVRERQAIQADCDRDNAQLHEEVIQFRLRVKQRQAEEAAQQSAKETADYFERMKSLHKISPEDICSIDGCKKQADIRRDGILYCLAHYYTTPKSCNAENGSPGINSLANPSSKWPFGNGK